MTSLFRSLGLVAFLASLGLLAWWWTRVAGLDAPGGGVAAAVWDALLFSAFALHHSIMARPGPQRQLARRVPADLLRSVYVWVASLLLAVTCVAWNRVGGTLYSADGATALLMRMLQAAGVALVLLAVRRIRLRELAGLDGPDPREPLQWSGPYALVRHPIYLGWVLIVFATPDMTADRLLFAALSSAYLIVAIPFEEAGLERQFGARYREYRAVVRWRLLPWLY